MQDNRPVAFDVIEKLHQLDISNTYTTLDTPADFKRVMKQYKDYTEVALDTETTGIDTITAKCLGYSFSFEPHVAYWVPIKADPQMKRLQRIINKRVVVFFNAGYDIAIIEKYGIKIEDDKIRDVMIACFFRDIPNYKRKAGLKIQAQEILQCETVELKDILKINRNVQKVAKNDVNFTELKPWQQRVYGCQDADVTMQLWLHDEIKAAIASMPDIWQLEHRLIRPMMKMYKNGVGVDLKKVDELDSILKEECDKCNAAVSNVIVNSNSDVCTVNKDGIVTFKHPELARLTKKKGFNLGSFMQRQYLLFDILNLPRTQPTKTGFSTDHDALESIEHEHDIIPVMMRYNQLVSRRNSYTKKIPRIIHPIDKRIHPSLWATGVKSGRFSCSDPNMQGISRDHAKDDPVHIRQIFVPAKGNLITAADYSQIELRIAASLSNEPKLCMAYNKGNIDIHRQTASEIFDVPFNNVTADQRDAAKTTNFSILTGISAYTLSARNKHIIPTPTMAQDLINNWFDAYKHLATWIKLQKQTARMCGSIKTYFGRIRPFPDIKRPREEIIQQRIQNLSNKEWIKAVDFAELHDIATRSLVAGFERQALSHVIQGTAADIMKMSIINVDNRIKREKMPILMILTVHDELLFEHPANIVDEVHDMLQDVMTFKQGTFGKNWVPLTVDIKSGKNWDEAH